jgi:glycosyltransferase involved in cell wall biosynthesis
MGRRILLVHNFYRQAGGEDRVVEAEADMLRQRGHAVFQYLDDNDRLTQLGKVRAAVETVWSRNSYRRIATTIRRNAIELCHFHNTFPLISPSAYYAARRLGVPVVQTLHNYRIMCPKAQLMRNGRICEDCVGRSVVWPGAVRKCYRNSYAASTVAAAMISTHHILGTWSRQVDRYIALTDFARTKFIQGGLPPEKIAVKANFVDPDPGCGDGAGKYALFVGRLSPEKGVATLLDAWQRTPGSLPLRIAGDGPMAGDVRDAVAANRNVEWLGEISRSQVLEQMRHARVLICPSTWYESFGLIIVEAFATGLPVIASDLGALTELIEPGRTGLLFRPGDADDLARQVRWAMEHPDRLQAMRSRARQRYESSYTADINYLALMTIYSDLWTSAPERASAGVSAMEMR